MHETADALLDVLRKKLDLPDLDYAEPPIPLTGGFWADIFAIRLAGAPPDLAGPLVARVMPAESASQREMVVQREVASLGFPAPVVRLTGDAGDGLGRPYMLMDRVTATPLLSGLTAGRAIVSVPHVARRLPGLLASTALRLHLLDPGPVRTALAREVPAASTGTSDMLRDLQAQADQLERPSLLAATRWLGAHQPEPERVSVCHGDLHPFNMLVGPDGTVTLVDWTRSIISEPAFDLGFTMLMFRGAPIDVPARLRPPLRKVTAWLAGRVLNTYRTLARPHGIAVDDDRLAWHTALHCVRVLIEVEQLRMAGRRDHPFLGMADDVQVLLGDLTVSR